MSTGSDKDARKCAYTPIGHSTKSARNKQGHVRTPAALARGSTSISTMAKLDGCFTCQYHTPTKPCAPPSRIEGGSSQFVARKFYDLLCCLLHIAN